MKRKYTVTERIILLMLKIGAAIGFFMLIGGIGNVDFATETGEVLTRAEEFRSYGISIAGLIISGICIFILDRTGSMSDM